MTEKSGERGGIRRAVDKVVDTVGGLAGKATAAMITGADKFVEHAAIGDRYEVEAAKLALRKSTSDRVTALAKKMLDDHTTSIHQLHAALEMNETKGVAKPLEDLDARRRSMIEHLERASDDAFDAMYLDQQILAHEETLTLLHGYRERGDNAQLRSFAASAAPVVDRHLQHARELKAH